MGWASGSSLFSEIIHVLKQEIPVEETRRTIYKKLIEAFEDADWDTQEECEGEDAAYDKALRELHHEWFEGR